MQMKIKKLSVLAFFTMTISFMSGYSVFYGTTGSPTWYLLYYGKYFLTIIFILISFFAGSKDKNELYLRTKYYKIFIFYPLIIFLYSAIIWIVETPTFDFITRGVSTTLFNCIAYLGGISFVVCLKEDALKCSIYAALFTYIISILMGLFDGGINFLSECLFFRTTSVQGRYTELHEVAFVLGLYLFFLIFINKRRYIKKTRLITVLGLIFFIIAWKRIGIAGLLLAAVFALIFRKRSNSFVRKLMKIIGFIGIVVCLIYVSFSVSDELIEILQKYGIDMMGRNIIYSYFRQFCEFSIDFFGRGVGFVSKQFSYATVEDLYNMISIKALHNDFMKLYIEIGFIGFIIWCWFWLIRIPAKSVRYAGREAGFWVLCLILYAFVTYSTDNTEGYFNFQMQLVMLIYIITYNYYNPVMIPSQNNCNRSPRRIG